MLSAYRKILDLLTRRERREFYRLIALTLVMGLIDVLGVASILPFLAVEVFVIFLITYVPAISLAVPRFFGFL